MVLMCLCPFALKSCPPKTAVIPIVIHYTYMFDVVKIRFKISFYPQITAKKKAQLRDSFVMHQL